MRPRISIRGCVRPSIRWSVGRSIGPSPVFLLRKLANLTNMTDLTNLTNLQIWQNLTNLTESDKSDKSDAILFKRTCFFRCVYASVRASVRLSLSPSIPPSSFWSSSSSSSSSFVFSLLLRLFCTGTHRCSSRTCLFPFFLLPSLVLSWNLSSFLSFLLLSYLILLCSHHHDSYFHSVSWSVSLMVQWYVIRHRSQQ